MMSFRLKIDVDFLELLCTAPEFDNNDGSADVVVVVVANTTITKSVSAVIDVDDDLDLVLLLLFVENLMVVTLILDLFLDLSP